MTAKGMSVMTVQHCQALRTGILSLIMFNLEQDERMNIDQCMPKVRFSVGPQFLCPKLTSDLAISSG